MPRDDTTEQSAPRRAEPVPRKGSFDSRVSQRHAAWLRGFVTEVYETAPELHDFACGTGRVARMLDGLVSTAHGYDTSEAALAKARAMGTPGVLHLIGEHDPPPQPAQPTLVTMFRWLLHADQAARDRAMEFAGTLLPGPDSGLLMLHNHGRTPSTRALRKITARATDCVTELRDAEVTELCARHGFEIVTRQGFSLLTRTWYHRAPFKWACPAFDDRMARHRVWAGLCSEMVYVARRAPGSRD